MVDIGYYTYMDAFEKVALKAVREAGAILMDNLHHIESVELKGRNEYVTNVDRKAEEAIKKIIKSSFPTHGIVAEESEAEDVDAEFVWFVDPISATKSYMHGLPHFATSVAMRQKDEIRCAAVLDSFYDELFYAEKGRGAWLNDEKIHVSAAEDLSKTIICIGIHTKGEFKVEEGMRYFRKLVEYPVEYRRIGSTSLQMCYVACGRIDAHVNNDSDIFAIPAGKLMVEEAGGIISDFSGDNWTFNSKDVVCSNRRIHKDLLKCLI